MTPFDDDDILDLTTDNDKPATPILVVTEQTDGKVEESVGRLAKALVRDQFEVLWSDADLSAAKTARVIILHCRVVEGLTDLATLRRIRASYPLKPLIVVTSNLNATFVLEAFRAGATDVADIAVDGRILAAKVKTLVTIGEAAGLVEVQNRELLLNMSRLRKEMETRRAAEVEKANARDQLAEATKLASLGEMAGSIAHEINTPLAIIMGSSDMLKSMLDDSETAPEDVKEVATEIEKMSDRIHSIIKGLKTFSRQGEEDPFEKTTVASIINDTLALCQEQMEREGIAFDITGLDPSLSFECRPTQVSQVVLNCLSNARHAVTDSEVKKISIEVLSKDSQITFRISDSGHGVPAEIKDKIMSAYFTTKPRGVGTGLGLSISTKIIQAHHGSFSFESGPGGVGTTFVATFPVVQKPEAVQKAS